MLHLAASHALRDDLAADGDREAARFVSACAYTHSHTIATSSSPALSVSGADLTALQRRLHRGAQPAREGKEL